MDKIKKIFTIILFKRIILNTILNKLLKYFFKINKADENELYRRKSRNNLEIFFIIFEQLI